MESKVSEVEFTEKKKSYFRELKEEFKKINWTSKIELIAFTKIVVVSTLIFSFLIYISDISVRGFLTIVNLISKVIFG